LGLFEPKRDEVPGGCRKWHTELRNKYPSSNICYDQVKRMGWAGHVARMSEIRNAYNILVGTPEGKRELGIPRRISKDTTKINLRETGLEHVDLINLD
jgi:hypothetical protein